MTGTSCGNRSVKVTMAEHVGRATRPRLAELVQLLVERVKATGRTVDPAALASAASVGGRRS